MISTKEYRKKHYDIVRKKQLNNLFEKEQDEYEFKIDIKKATGIITAASLFLIIF